MESTASRNCPCTTWSSSGSSGMVQIGPFFGHQIQAKQYLAHYIHAHKRPGRELVRGQHRDRKSTRLNSSHLVISYAVFCLKKKNTKIASDARNFTHMV